MYSCTFLATKHSQTIHQSENSNQNLPAKNLLVSLLLSFNKSLCYIALYWWNFSRVSAFTFSQDSLSFIEVLPSNYGAWAGRGQYEIKPIRLCLSNFDCLWWVSHPLGLHFWSTSCCSYGLWHPEQLYQVLRALGIYKEISFDPRTYTELVGPKMGLL